MQTTTFREWVDGVRGQVATSRFLARLSVATGINIPTLYYASRGVRVAYRVAERLRAHIREQGGDVSLESLVAGPSRSEVVRSGAGRTTVRAASRSAP